MDEETNEAPRVTRARTRRQSVLDTESRPLTPLLDLTADRASPRPMRRTRLNSATIDLRTPTRTTRSSMARGETPEPATPTPNLSAAKRITRTPAKSVRKQLPLPEGDDEEEYNKKDEPTAEPNNAKANEVEEVAELIAVDSTFDAPVLSSLASDAVQTPIATSQADKRRVTRSMSKTPPVHAEINTSPKQSDTNNSQEEKSKQTKQSLEIANEIVDSSQVDAEKSFHSDEGLTEELLSSPQVKNKSLALATPKFKVKVKVIDIRSEIQETTTQHTEDSKAYKALNNSMASGAVDREVGETTPSDKKEDVILSVSGDATDKPVEEDVSTVTVIPIDDASPTDAQISADLNLPELTPKKKSRFEGLKESEPFKSVVFNNSGQDDEAVKLTYPKTPRTIATCREVINLAEGKIMFGTPLKPINLKGRNSSTPLSKIEPVQSQENVSSKPSQPPLKIDMIKPFSELEDTAPKVVIAEEKTQKLCINEDESDVEQDEGEHDEEGEEDLMCEFFDEVEVIENYQSGDSMDSSGRRELQDNQVQCDGESVGSQDTIDELSEDSADEKMSFIVSDNEDDDGGDSEEADENDNNNGDSEIESLCFSSASEESVKSKENKKRRRIIMHDSSDDEEQNNNKPNIEKDAEGLLESEAMESKIKDKNITGIKEETAKLAINSSDKASHLSVCEKSPESISKKDNRLNKTAPALVGEVSLKDAGMSVEEVLSSSNEIDDKEPNRIISSNNKTIYEVSDSGEESIGAIEKDVSYKQPPVEQPTTESEVQNEIEKIDSLNETAMVIDENSHETTLGSNSDGEKQGLVVHPVATTSKSSAFHKKQKREEEGELLTELASCDLSHLQQMFNPLQKSRRQTLYVQDPQITAKEPKLKRRSEQLNSDVNPSQSFIETLDEEKRQQSKRKRLSKSFCGAVDDGLETSVLPEVQLKKAKMAADDEPAADVIAIDEPIKPVKVELPPLASSLPVHSTEEDKEKVVQPKSRSDYLDYCDAILLAANAAKLEQKKQRNAAGRNQKKPASEPLNIAPSTIVTTSSEGNKPNKIKKNVKRLQATKQAVKHAMQLLVPDSANKEPQSLARKLSPQPETTLKDINVKPQPKKKNQQPQSQMSPVKSSDEENQRASKRIKTSAGYVTVINKTKQHKPIETFKISSGLVEVEPCTPTQKYFKEIPPTPTSRSGFKEMPVTPKLSKNKTSSLRNPATESALRFKREMFGRNFK